MKWLVFVSIILVVLVALLKGPLETGASLVAKRTCSCWFLQGRANIEDELAIPALKYAPFSVRRLEHSVQVLIGPFLVSEAFFLGQNSGCSLVPPSSSCPIDGESSKKEDEEEEQENVDVIANRAQVGLSVDSSRRLDEILDAEMVSVLPNGQPQKVRGLIVMKNGLIIGERYRTPTFGYKTLQHGWSMTKSLLGALIGKRIQEGLFDLEQKVVFWNGSASEFGLTVYHLLNMTSGLDWVVSSCVQILLFC